MRPQVDARSRISRRRALLVGASVGTAFWSSSFTASARARLAVGGRVTLRIPYATAAIDPHRLDDPLAAIFGEALFDALYTREAGAIVPVLAEAEPEIEGEGLLVRIRRGVVTAEGRPIDARDVVSSIARARRAGARGWLADLPAFERKGNDALRFATRDAARLMTLLASPLTAIVPIAFTAEKPDGTGAFQLQRRAEGIALVRNKNAARGPALLDEIVVRAAPDLGASLRAFEAGADDIGWLGAGLHSPRAHARTFDAGAVAWIVLRTGRDGATWDAPGVAQRILDGLAPAKLAYLGLGPPWRQERDEGWNGPAGDLLVREDTPYLVEVARTLAALLSRPGHELTPRTVPVRDLQTRRAKRDHLLMLDVVRPVAPGAQPAWIALASSEESTAANEAVAHPPRVVEAPPRSLTRTLRLGIVGELRVQGARIPEIAIPSGESGWDLALATRGRRPA